MHGFKAYLDNISHIPQEVFEGLVNQFKRTTLQKGSLFTKEGEYAQQVGFLQSGIIRAYVRATDGQEYTKQFFVGPCIVGAYASLLTKSPNNIIQEALTDCDLWVINYASIESLYQTNHHMERFGRKVAEKYYLQKEQLLVEMAIYDARKRYELLRKRYPNIESQIPQYHIASYLGVSPTQLSRIRMKMRSETI